MRACRLPCRHWLSPGAALYSSSSSSSQSASRLPVARCDNACLSSICSLHRLCLCLCEVMPLQSGHALL